MHCFVISAQVIPSQIFPRHHFAAKEAYFAKHYHGCHFEVVEVMGDMMTSGTRDDWLDSKDPRGTRVVGAGPVCE